MPKFRLHVVDPASQKKSVFVTDMPTEQDAVTQAKQRGYLILHVQSDAPRFITRYRPAFNWNKNKEVLLFIKKLGLLLASSLPLSDSLLFLARGTKNKAIGQVILSLHTRISEGTPLSEAMRSFPAFFSSTICSVIMAGEKSGHMDEALTQLSHYLEGQDELSSAIRQAIAYPALLIVVSIVIISLLLTIAIPDIAEQLLQSNIPLPTSTRMIIALSHFITDRWQAILVATGIICLGINQLLKRETIKIRAHKNMLAIPLIGTLLKKTQTASVLMTLNILTQFSVPLLDAFRVSQGVIRNHWLRIQLREAYDEINEGSTIYHALVNARMLDNTTLALLSAGERSGEFHSMVSYATQLLQKEIKVTLSGFIKLLEPLLIFIIGFIVLFIFMSIMQPMLSLNNMAQ